jgi:hypothetical protein
MKKTAHLEFQVVPGISFLLQSTCEKKTPTKTTSDSKLDQLTMQKPEPAITATFSISFKKLSFSGSNLRMKTIEILQLSGDGNLFN